MVTTALGTKTLPSAAALHASACSPTHPLVALASPPTSNECKVALYRTGANPDLVWEWVNVGEPPKPGGPGLGLKGKAKAAPVGKVQQLAWSTRGTYLAVAISPATATASSTLAILSLHSGQPLHSPPVTLPTSSAISHLSWQPLKRRPKASVSSWAVDLVIQLPGLPKIQKESPAAGAGAPGGPGSGPGLAGMIGGAGPAGGGGGAGVFGAKQAMLERERAKEAQRALNLRAAASEGFPTFLSDVRPDETSSTGDGRVKAMMTRKGEEHDETEETILCVGDEAGQVHLYLGGSVYLGSVETGEGNSVVGLTVWEPSPSSSTATIRLAVHTSTSSSLAVRDLILTAPPTFELVVRQSSAMRATIQHAFEALQEVRNLWDEARRIGKGWLQRVADVSRPQGVTLAPVDQLHLLLVTGRPTRSLHDFLASKMNERGLAKWEQAMDVALERMKRVGWMSVEPAMERVIILLLEVDGWARWPAKFRPYGFDRSMILKAIEVAKEAIRSTARLNRVVEEEARCFKAFRSWLRYELDKLAQHEGSEVRPVADFHPLPVSSYIADSLGPLTSPINPYLSMGLASVPLAQNHLIAAAEQWVDQIDLDRGRHAGRRDETLEDLLKRLGEELQGRLDRASVETHAPSRKEPLEREGAPTAPFARSTEETDDVRPAEDRASASSVAVPTSIPVLLHLVAKMSGRVMDQAVRSVGRSARLGEGLTRGVCDDTAREGTKARRHRSKVDSKGQLWEVWVVASTLHLARTGGGVDAETDRTAFKLGAADGATYEILGLDFVGSSELAVALEASGGTGPKNFVALFDLPTITLEPRDNPSPPPIPLDRIFPLDSHFSPTHVSFSSQGNRRFACTLAGEGRRIEFVALDASQESSDVEMA
ncbi:hypothetical protein JCM10212_003393 [Sporobolomyces blumeae]